jgi:hypothetical protein
VELAVDLSLEAEAGVVITRAKAGSALSATLTWKRLSPRSSDTRGRASSASSPRLVKSSARRAGGRRPLTAWHCVFGSPHGPILIRVRGELRPGVLAE